MYGFGGMKIQRRRPGGTERRSDFSRDDAALAHARNHHATAAGMQALNHALKIGAHRPGNAFRQLPQCFRLNADNIGPYGFHSRTILAERFAARLDGKWEARTWSA